MYANLKVTPAANAVVRPDAIAKRTIARLRSDSPSSGESLFAHAVEAHSDGSLTVRLDDHEDEGSYAAPAGVVRIEGACTIQASF